MKLKELINTPEFEFALFISNLRKRTDISVERKLEYETLAKEYVETTVPDNHKSWYEDVLNGKYVV